MNRVLDALGRLVYALWKRGRRQDMPWWHGEPVGHVTSAVEDEHGLHITGVLVSTEADALRDRFSAAALRKIDEGLGMHSRTRRR